MAMRRSRRRIVRRIEALEASSVRQERVFRRMLDLLEAGREVPQ